MERKKFDEYLEKLRPTIEKLVREVDNEPAACITGFIFSLRPKGFIQFGNVCNKGDDLIQLHTVLAILADIMAEDNPYSDVPYSAVGMGNKAVGQAPEEIADTLARVVLTTGLELSHVPQALELAQRYIQARRVPEKSGQ